MCRGFTSTLTENELLGCEDAYVAAFIHSGLSKLVVRKI